MTDMRRGESLFELDLTAQVPTSLPTPLHINIVYVCMYVCMYVFVASCLGSCLPIKWDEGAGNKANVFAAHFFILVGLTVLN